MLMGSMTAPLSLSYSEIIANNWEIIGQFMYPADAFARLVDMLRSGQLDIGTIRPPHLLLGQSAGRDAGRSRGRQADLCGCYEPTRLAIERRAKDAIDEIDKIVEAKRYRTCTG